ncbi:dentin sialophosphoprotein-like [Saccostrea echinata]|uniref:dentin sialophosphoprotein-like n=1 Tax=Saccostrea echinata TaxID=191078 RepID=UPI002A82D036|nr:dentin sialophosphoprotein-like [Saccostrea echinata]
MPSKQSNERFLKADRRNQLEKVKLERKLKIYDKEKWCKALEIDREKEAFAKSLDAVRRTSGFSDQGIPPAGKGDTEYLSAPVYRMGVRLSEQRLMGWRSQEEEERKRTWSSHRLSSHRTSNSDNRRQGNDVSDYDTEVYEDNVFSDDESIQDLAFDPKHMAKSIMDSYKSLFSQEDFKLDKDNVKRIRSAKFCRSISEIDLGVQKKSKQRPHTAVSSVKRGRGASLPLPQRPSTATACRTSTKDNVVLLKPLRSKFYRHHHSGSDFDSDGTDDVDSLHLSSQSITNVKNSPQENPESIKEESHSENGSSKQTHRKLHHRVSLSRLNDGPNTEPIPEDGILKTTYDKNRISSESLGSDKAQRCKSAKQRKNSSTVPMQSIHENGEMKYSNSSDVNTSDSESDLSNSRRARISSSRQRHLSGSTVTSDSRDYFPGSSVYSSMSDLSLDSNGQRRPSKWREFVCADNANIPSSKSLVSVTTVLRAALAFSKTARQRALSQLVQEQSTDANEIIRQERLRRLDSKNSILAAISQNFAINVDNMNHGKSTDAFH